MKVSKLLKILELIRSHGLDDFVEAYHDTLCLLPPGPLDEKLEEELRALGVDESEDYGWHITT